MNEADNDGPDNENANATQAIATQGVEDASSELHRIDALRESLKPFFVANSSATLSEPSEGRAIAIINNPWGDESLAFHIPRDSTKAEVLIEALNNVFLPHRYSALYHRDTKSIEFIWTAFPLSPLWSDIPGRSFKFRFDSKELECSFAASSDRLLALAKRFRRVSAGNSSFRNLESFHFHVAISTKSTEEKEATGLPATAPFSFWVRGVEWDEDEILPLVNHLNFCLTYYDAISPTIVIHSPKEAKPANPQTRFPFESFPKQIDCRELDDILLHFWTASRSGDDAGSVLI